MAFELGADLIVTHHPLIFGGDLKAVNDTTETGRCLLTLIENGIAAINAHTNLDMAPGGVNDVLAQTLGLTNIQVADPEGTDEEGRPYGLIRSGEVTEMPLERFLPIVKVKLGCDALRYVNGGKPVRKVCVGGGSCAGYLAQAAAHGFDTFVTADVKYNSSALPMSWASISSTRATSTRKIPPCSFWHRSCAALSRRRRSSSRPISK